ncbi:DUF2281 domain-containing protein [candidate division KSB1 bacterium]|nr:DUF2281 domain-containing protein [candidate division KSB1 bacterium]
MSVHDVEKKIKDLPEFLIPIVDEYVDFLIFKYKSKSRPGFRFDWAGGLDDLKTKYTSVELQHKSTDWR